MSILEADYEKLGVFYLGKRCDAESLKPTDALYLYDSQHLLTHAVCIGMTGSGKTGLCLGLMEEAAIDNIPIIAVDPKGDIANLLLTFPQLRGEDFLPWIDADQARRAGSTAEQFAQQQAQAWQKGLTEWGESGQRIARLKEAAEFAIYTPGSSAGIAVSIMRSFAAPPQAVLSDADAFRDRVAATTGSLLALLGVDADPLRSREHILLSTIFKDAWQAGKRLSLPVLIQLIQSPGIAQVGAIDLETFYPAKDRFALSMMLNNLLASPGFAAWMQGQPLDLDHLLHTAKGKPRVAIFSTAHLDDSQRMFFTSLLLNEIISWMRAQSGTSSLRAIFYMDEIYGYFPPTANPPTKKPLLLLMKQARAFGLGIVLASQNPVDLDYKGLSNAGTWFIGRLQTERDKMRVLDGLEGAAADAGQKLDRKRLDRILSALDTRTFLVNDVHSDQPQVLKTRFTLSYLRGPLTRDQIRTLMKDLPPDSHATAVSDAAAQVVADPGANRALSGVCPSPAPANAATATATAGSGTVQKPLLPPGISEYYLPVKHATAKGSTIVYRPFVIAIGDVRFIDAKAPVDTTLQYTLLIKPPEQGVPALNFEAAAPAKVWLEQLLHQAEPDAQFVVLTPGLSEAKNYSAWSKAFVTWLYNAKKLKLFRSEMTEEYSKPRESERDFRVRITLRAREQRDAAAQALHDKYDANLRAIQQRRQRAEQAVADRRAMAQEQQWSSAVSVGATVLGALMSKRGVGKGTIDHAASAARSVGRASKQQQNVENASETLSLLNAQEAALTAELQKELDDLDGRFDPLTTALTEVVIAPKKTNVTVPLLALAWAPHIKSGDDAEAPAWI